MRAAALITSVLLFACACGDDDGSGADAGPVPVDGGGIDAGAVDAGAVDAGTVDAGSVDAGSGEIDGGEPDAGAEDAGATPDAGTTRTAIIPGFCPSTATAPGLYRGTLASNTNDLTSPAGCGISGAPGRDGAVRVELEPGQTLTATYRHAGDGILYILDDCPVESSCLDGSDGSLSGAETVTWTNDGASTNPVYVILDSDSLSGPQTFELDLFVTGP